MSKIIRRTAGMKKEIGAALVVALQMITLTLIGLMAPLAGGPQQSANAATYAVTADFVPDDTTNYNTLTGLCGDGGLCARRHDQLQHLDSAVGGELRHSEGKRHGRGHDLQRDL